MQSVELKHHRRARCQRGRRASLPFVALVLPLVVFAAQGRAETLLNGSTGADGPLEVMANTTLPLPPDGVFHFTTITVAAGATLRFQRNALNTPVYLLATDAVVIEGTISVDGGNATTFAEGAPGPGGYAGGTPGDADSPPGAGLGPGGGLGGSESASGSTGAGGGGYSTLQYNYGNDAQRGAVYGGSLLIPLVGGSGGGGTTGTPGHGGGGGGGAILIASNTSVHISGKVSAVGGVGRPNSSNCTLGYLNHGSGGAVRLVAPVVTGGGTIDVRGGATATTCSYRAGAGRVRIDAIDRSGVQLTLLPNSAQEVSAIRSVGTYLVARPTVSPRVDIIEAVGTTIPGDAPVFITLPFGSPSTQTVRVALSGFASAASLVVRLTPSSGTPTTYGPFDVPVNGGVVTHDVTVEIQGNNPTHIQAWAQ